MAQPIKKEIVVGLFGKKDATKLLNWLNDCCTTFCDDLKTCLGISSTGNPSLVLNQQGNWNLSISLLNLTTSSGVTVYSVPVLDGKTIYLMAQHGSVNIDLTEITLVGNTLTFTFDPGNSIITIFYA